MTDGTLQQAENLASTDPGGEADGDAAWQPPVLAKLKLAEAETRTGGHGIDGPANYS